MVEAGETLKSTREAAGVSLDEASKDIDIPVIILEQIESGAIGAFEDIYELKRLLLEYSKYLGVDQEMIITKFNEYMFDYTSKIPMDEIEKAVREKNKEKEEEDRVYSPYTVAYKKERTLPYFITGFIVIILVILAVLWSIKQITVDNNNGDVVGYVDVGGNI